MTSTAKNKEYLAIREDFAQVDESDFLTCAELQKRASNLKATYDRQLAELEKAMDDAKVYVEFIENSVSIRMNDKSVSDGERKAKCDEQVLNAKYGYNQAKFLYNDMLTYANDLNNIYYTCKSFYENATRNLREGR